MVAGIYLMLKFKWTVIKTIQYICIKQPCFYIVPQYHAVLQTLENNLCKKFPDQVTNEWDPEKAELDNKQHLYITNTYLNTRIALDSQSGEDEKIQNSNGAMEEIQKRIPRNNRNMNIKSNT